MEKITAYKLTDGSLVENKYLAIKKQAEITIKAKLSLFFEVHSTLRSSEYEEAVEACFIHREELIKILKNEQDGQN